MRTNARTAATRDEAITAAALLLSDKLPHWTESDYVRGICEVIADTFGADVDDHDQAKDAVWSEIAHAPLPPIPSSVDSLMARGVGVRVGDPDPTPEAPPHGYCEVQHETLAVVCTWEPGHSGDHVAGDGAEVVAVWPQAVTR